ncbi:MAG: 23S rRNA (uracil(1939)-C(5))-methyltransferase RlmD [Lachnospiraceae bacterium]|nr:23S rRNA (uracil(1939)-C(5))-methyltransferase RlmD [Lachnospiraceae bacterium]
MTKNDEVTVKIEDLSETGEGIGHADGLTLFVKDAVIGDTVKAGITKVKKTYCYARTIEVIHPSPDRTEPACAIHRQCGGCQLQALSYSAQLKFKRKKVEACFERIGGFSFEDGKVKVGNTLGMEKPWNYRNKAQFPIGKDKNGKTVAGFYAGRTHAIIPWENCPIEFPGHEKILAAVLSYMDEAGVSAYDEENGSGVVRHVLMRKAFATGEIMVVLVVNARKIKRPELLIKKLGEIDLIVSIQLNINTEKTNVILGKECVTLYGRDYIEDMIGDVRFRISALSFYQVNPMQTRVLYGKALEACFSGNDKIEDSEKEGTSPVIWDMYCGIGTISLFLAKKAKQVYGVEIIPEAIANAKENAKLNGITNAEFFVGAAEDVVPLLYEKDPEKYRADIVVVDPPRKGCDEALLQTIIKMAPEKIVYVSCDPATLARDCRVLADGGYGVRSVQPVDMFPHSVHVETVCLLSNTQRPKKESYITLDVEMEDYYRIKNEGKNSTT